MLHPIPDWLPEIVGLWKIGGQYQECQNRIKAITLIKTERRQRLFGCCLALRVLPIYNKQYPDDFRLYDIIKIAEQYADDIIGRDELTKAQNLAREIYLAAANVVPVVATAAASVAVVSADKASSVSVVSTVAVQAVVESVAVDLRVAMVAVSVERINQSRLYGLFLPVKIDIDWRTNSVTELANQFYNGDTTIAPILADELEEVGCNNTLWLHILRECPEVYHKGMTFIDNLIDK